jgi:hypothetical protein
MLPLLEGEWKLVYTSNSELLAILALSKLPFVTIGDITQHVETGTNTVENKVRSSRALSGGPLPAPVLPRVPASPGLLLSAHRCNGYCV